MSLVFACIAPHGDMELDAGIRSAMEELGRRFDAAAPDVAVVVTPHNVHVEGHFAVITAGRVGEWETERAAAQTLLAADLPILGVSYGGNDPATAEMPIDWGTEIPLTFMRAPKVVVVSSARDRPLDEHLRLGEAIAALPGRVALVEAGKADSLWQLLVLQGAVGEASRADVLAYAAPTYYGMLVADVPLQTAA